MNILLVDDEREEREGISFLIRKFRYPLEIVQAASGREALAILSRQKIDILFTDVKMPVMSGLELARAVRETDKEIKIIIFSAYAEFEYAKQAIEMNALRYLLKPIEIDEFKDLMDDVILSLEKSQRTNEKNRRNTLFKIFTGVKIDEEQETKIAETLFPEAEGAYRFLDIEFVNNYFEEYETVFLQIVKRHLGEKTEYIELYPNESCLLILDPELNKSKKLSGQIKNMVNEILRDVRDELLLFVSPLFYSIEDLEKQVEKINHIKPDIFGYGNKIIEMDRYFDRTEHYVPDIESAKDQLLSSLESRNPEIIRKQNQQFIQAIRSTENVSRLYIQNTLYMVLKMIYDRVPGMETEEVLIAAESLFREKTPKTILEEYENIMEKMLAAFQCVSDESDIILKIKGLVEREYSRDISLNYVADCVHLAPAYVSYIFKQETGQTLVKYVTDVKMAKARKFLEDKDMKIFQVGRACGYENQSYFNRLFKNYHGVTPKQYREQR